MDASSNSQAAGSILIVVDMQECYLNSYKNQEYVRGRIESVNRAIGEARGKGIPVIYMEHEYVGVARLVSLLFEKGAGIQGRDGFHIDRRIDKSADESVYLKTELNLFSVDLLLDRLKKDRVETVLLAGQDGIYCIQCSAHGGRKRGFMISILDPCVVASNERKWRLHKAVLESAGVRIFPPAQ